MDHTLSPTRWAKLQKVYDDALRLPLQEWQTFLRRECADDDELRREIESLLNANANATDDFLQSSPFLRALNLLAQEDTRSEETDQTNLFEAELSIGMQLDNRYEIRGKLDAGGMGEVYQARDQKLNNRLVVVKVFKKSALHNPWMRKKILDEANAQSRIQHPHVATIYDKGILPSGEPYLVMEFVPGITLWQLLKERDGLLEVSEVAEMMQQIGRAVDAIHQAHLVHRDLKPKNIMVHIHPDSGEYAIKVIDFGIVRDMDKSTVIGQSPGTVAYMSPEQLAGQETPYESDIFALGLIAYEMLTGHRPFNASVPVQLRELMKEGVRINPSTLRPEIPQAADRVILGALAFDARKRGRSAREFGDELAQALIGAKDSSPRKLPWRQTIVVALLLLAGGIAAWWVSSQRGSPAVETPSGLNTAAAERSLNYSLHLRKNPKRYRNSSPVTTLSAMVFEAGDLIRLHLRSPQAGYLYVINQRPPKRDESVKFNVLFPITVIKQGSAAIAADQTFQIPPRSNQPELDWLELDQERGEEMIWLIWSEQSIPEMEAIKVWANPKDQGEIHDRNQIAAVNQYLTSHVTATSRTESIAREEWVKLTGQGSVLIGLVKFEHQ